MTSPGISRNVANASGIVFRKTRGSTVTNGEVSQFAIGVQITGGGQTGESRLRHQPVGA